MTKKRTESSVDPALYDQGYFARISQEIDFSEPLRLERFAPKHRHMADMLSLSPEDRVVDFGCGTGHLSFCLYARYGCSVLGIDYAQDAIDLAKRHLDQLRSHTEDQGRIEFLCVGIQGLPQLSRVSAVYLSDVVEHMRDWEIAGLMDQVKTWNDNGSLRCVVHTDNNLYLRWVRPFMDLLGLAARTQTLHKIRERNHFERETHVNLTTPALFKRKMARWGFVEKSRSYGMVTSTLVRDQLGPLQNIPGLASLCTFGVRRLEFLSPSFYAIYGPRSV